MKCIIDAVTAMGKAMIDNKELLTQLDAAIGDADHGINMARGFDAVQAKLASISPDSDAAAILKLVGMTLLSTVGGASGPLYGTAFLRAAATGQGKTTLTADDLGQMLQAAIGGIKERGKAIIGEKTMLDALEPAYEAFMASKEKGGSLADHFAAARDQALAGVEYTKTIIAKKGRASYLGERSLGHQDPGATSAYLMLSALADYCRQQGV